MATNVLQVLTQAIEDRRCVALRYQEQRAIRVVEPHAIYADEQSHLVLDAYQVQGYSSSHRPLPFWRPFQLKKILEVQVLPQVFTPRTAEGFTSARLKYKQGLVAIVKPLRAPAPAVATEAMMEVGPPRPPHLRRSV